MRSFRQRVLHLGLWPQTVLAVSLGFLALFIGFWLLSQHVLRDSHERLLSERVVIAQLTASRLDSVLSESVYELEQAYHSNDTRTSAEAQIMRYMQSESGDFSAGITFLDPNGLVMSSYPPGLYPVGNDLSGEPYIAQALESRNFTVSDPFVEPNGQRPVIAVAVPVYDGQRFIGLLKGRVDLSRPTIIEPLQEAARIGRTAHAGLIDREGRNLVSTLDLPFLSPGAHVTFYRRAMARGEAIVETVPFEADLPGETRGELRVVAFAPLQLAPWGVAVGGEPDETFADVRELWSGMVVLGGLTLAAVWGATMITTRRLLQPVRRLTEGAQRIAQGNLDTPLEEHGSGEIGALAMALEHMRQQLQSDFQKLAEWNETLEMRISERSRELEQRQRQTQQLLRRVITAQEGERARVSRDLHDGIGQIVAAMEFSLHRLEKSLPARNTKACEQVLHAQVMTQQIMVDLRRIIAALRPGVLDQLGLVPSLVWMGNQMLLPLGVEVTIEQGVLPERLPGEIETTLFRIAQEAMVNVARHSQARHLAICLDNSTGQVVMTLADDGQGFDPTSVSLAFEHGRGWGLIGMQERASLAGGEFTVESTPGKGTTVRVVIPMPEETVL
jgi:signal transduction histidine kinase